MKVEASQDASSDGVARVEPAAASVGFRLPLMAKAPTIDGTMDPDEWRGAALLDRFMVSEGGMFERRRVRGYVGATADHLFVAIQSQLPDEGVLAAVVDKNSLRVAHDDSVEVYICPAPDASDTVDYQFIVNSRGMGGYNIHKTGEPDEDVSWHGNWTQAHGAADGWWTFECAIPIKSMSLAGAGRKATDGVFAINLARNWKPDWGWSSLSGGYPNSGLRFQFTNDPAPVVSNEWIGDPLVLPASPKLRVFNPSDRTLELKAEIGIFRNRMPEIAEEKILSLAPGAEEEIGVDLDAGDPTTRFEMSMRVLSADTATVFYDRSVKWAREKESFRWVVGKPKDAPPVDFKFAYYPTLNKLRLLADITNLPEDVAPSAVNVSIRTEKEKTPVAQMSLPASDFKDGRCERSIDLPRLTGQFEIALQAQGEGVIDKETVKTFERQEFPWEGFEGGRSTTVYPPFEPLRLEGNRLRAVLREYEWNGLGLIDQVLATSASTQTAKPVLAAPMRYAVTVDGSSASLTADRSQIVESEDHRVVMSGGFAAGSFSAGWKNTWDYDGCVRVDLTLKPTGGRSLDALTLEIPFLSDSAPMMHANSDRIRAPVIQRVPDGDGVVWDSRKLACDEYIRNFCPYVFLGSPVRGLCFFAENDLNWGWDQETPSVELVRSGNEVLLRVHLVNAPEVILQERTLSFGLLAAPVKPMMSKEGESPNWWRHRYYRDKYNLLGTDINWFARGDCGSVYPAGKDLELWRALARGNRERLSEEEIEAVVDRGKGYFEPYGEGAVAKYEDHVRRNLPGRFGMKMVYYYNRASCQLFPEFETFKDEWTLDDYRSTPKGDAIYEIKIVPSESYIDYNLYWYGQSFDIGGNWGVYWDNWFIAPTSNTVMTDAYPRGDGSVAPASGIWGLRELAKRTFVYMNERGMLPFVFPHMTSFSPLPMLSFATVQYDWEWKYSSGDVQDRFSREYLGLVSSGELAGVWPAMLHDHGPQSEDPWIQRTLLAVRLAHELDGVGGCVHADVPAHRTNREIAAHVMDMLERPGLETYKYWEDRPLPVAPDSDDLVCLVYSVPGEEALAIVTSYASKDVEATLAIDAVALGFSGAVRATDVETGEPVSIVSGRAVFALKRHDMKLLRLQAH